jgi:tryprostatin B 6-hydroxylase
MGHEQHLSLLAVAAGVVAHQGVFKYGDWHLHGPHILASHLALGLLMLFYVSRDDYVLVDAFRRVAVIAAAYLGGLFSSMTIYRLFFHRLSSFRGPRLAAITKFWHVWHIRYSTNHIFQQKIYEGYGPIVRTGE